MGFSESFPQMYFSGLNFSIAYQVSGSRNMWPNGVQIESLMSWMDDCARYHRWDEQFGISGKYKVTPEGFESYINNERIIGNIGLENLSGFQENFSQLRGRAWSYEEFWHQLYSQLAYMYKKTDPHTNYELSSNYRKFKFLEPSNDLNSHISGIVNSHNSHIEDENEKITFNDVLDTIHFGDPYYGYFTPSGLSRYTKMQRQYYDPLLSHPGFTEIDWHFNPIGHSFSYFNSKGGYLYDSIHLSYNSDWICTSIDGIRCYNYLDIFQYDPLDSDKYQSHIFMERSFPNDKEQFIKDLLIERAAFDDNELITKRKYQSINYSTNINIGVMNITPLSIASINGDILGNTWLGTISPYYQWASESFVSGEYVPTYPDIFIEESSFVEYAQIIPILPLYLEERYGIKNICYLPYVYNDKIVPSINATLSCNATFINRGFTVSVYIGSGNFYNKYGPPTQDKIAKGFMEVAENTGIDLEIRYGLSKIANASTSDIANGNVLLEYSKDNTDPNIELDLERVFTLKGEGEKLYLWIAFIPSDFFTDTAEEFKKSVVDNFNSFLDEELKFNPFNKNEDFASVFSYEPSRDFYRYKGTAERGSFTNSDGESFVYEPNIKYEPINMLKPTREQVFNFKKMSYDGFESVEQIYIRAWMPGDLEYYIDEEDNIVLKKEYLQYYQISDFGPFLDEGRFPLEKNKIYYDENKHVRFVNQSGIIDNLFIGGYINLGTFESPNYVPSNLIKIPLSRKLTDSWGYEGYFPLLLPVINNF